MIRSTDEKMCAIIVSSFFKNIFSENSLCSSYEQQLSDYLRQLAPTYTMTIQFNNITKGDMDTRFRV